MLESMDSSLPRHHPGTPNLACQTNGTTLTTGERVRIEDQKTGIWIPAKVTQHLERARSYKVESDGEKYRRNIFETVETY